MASLPHWRTLISPRGDAILIVYCEGLAPCKNLQRYSSPTFQPPFASWLQFANQSCLLKLLEY
ncbi:hypothetical protein ABIE49_004040 [Bradyrhizobium sp. OAE829]